MAKSNGIPENPFAGTRYTKMHEGANRFRLGEFIEGWEWWTEDDNGKRTPHRLEIKGDAPTSLKKVPDEHKKNARYFRAYVVWNYELEVTQVLELTQRTIIEPIINFTYDEDWGNVKDYDIVINRKGEGLDSEYTVLSKPKSPFKFKFEKCDLTKLFSGGDPFEMEAIDTDDLDKK